MIKRLGLTKEEFEKMSEEWDSMSDEDRQKYFKKVEIETKKHNETISDDTKKRVDEVIQARGREQKSLEIQQSQRKSWLSEYKELFSKTFNNITQEMINSLGLSHVKLDTLGEDLIKGFQNTDEIFKEKGNGHKR